MVVKGKLRLAYYVAGFGWPPKGKTQIETNFEQ